MPLTLDALRGCFEGAVPAQIATCSADGVPNIAYLSQVHYVDGEHVALSFQFFSKTRENVLANPYAVLQVIDPDSGAHYHFDIQYRHTETEGPLFEYMKARLAGVASQTGMSKVFVLRGSDVYRVLAIRCAAPAALARVATRASRLPALRGCVQRLAACADLAMLLDELLAGLQAEFQVRHAMVLMYDAQSARLYTVASLGYEASGVGSEVALGEGVIGVAAQEQTPIRIGFMTADYSYSRALGLGAGDAGGREIPFPGLAEPHSQLAVPIVLGGRLLGMLYVESEDNLRFDYEDEDALVALAGQLAYAMQLFEEPRDPAEMPDAAVQPARVSGTPAVVRRYRADNSIFIDDDYLIKGVAGAILWKLLSDHERLQRREFSNRELRLDASLRLPDISDNLEARLILLQRRLAEHCPFLRIEKTGRGRFRLLVERPLQLSDIPAA